MNEYLISSCQNGGLHRLSLDGKYTTTDSGNIRGLTQVGSSIVYVKDDHLFKVVGDQRFQLFKLPCHGHDIKYRSKTKTFLFMGTQNRKLYELSLIGEIIKEIQYDHKYWMNCIEITDEGVIVFLSCKRPLSDSKIIFYDQSFNVCSEYECPKKDEIHSPLFYNGELYWCRSNVNSVVRSDLSFSQVEEVVVNHDGYTRGLYIDDECMLVGTSENRHAENSNCRSNLDHGCVHQYKKQTLIASFKLHCREVYDILKFNNVKYYL